MGGKSRIAQKEYGLSKAAAELMMAILQRREKPEDVPSRDTLYQQVRKRLDRIPRQHKLYTVHNGCLHIEDERTGSLKRVLVKEDEPEAIWQAHVETLANGRKVHHCAHATYRRLKQNWMGGSRRKCDPLRFCETCRSENDTSFLGSDGGLQTTVTSTPTPGAFEQATALKRTASSLSGTTTVSCDPSPEVGMSFKRPPEPYSFVAYVMIADEPILWFFNTATERLGSYVLPSIEYCNDAKSKQDINRMLSDSFLQVLEQLKSAHPRHKVCIMVSEQPLPPWATGPVIPYAFLRLPKYHDFCLQAAAAVAKVRRNMAAFSLKDSIDKYNSAVPRPELLRKVQVNPFNEPENIIPLKQDCGTKTESMIPVKQECDKKPESTILLDQECHEGE